MSNCKGTRNLLLDGDLGFGTCTSLDCNEWAIVKFRGEAVCLECFEGRMKAQMKAMHDLFHRLYPEDARRSQP